MKKNEKKVIGVLVGITIVVVIIGVIWMNQRQEKVEEANKMPEEEFVEVLEDGTRLNTSNKLQETKTIDGLEIRNFQLTEKGNVTLLLGTIINNTNETKGGYPVDIKIVDKEGNEIIKVGGYIGEIKPGESTQLSSSATFDYANAYDFSITK